MRKLFTLIAALVCAVCVNAQTRTTLWEGSKTFDSTWPSITIPTSEFATAKVGDKIIVTVDKADSWNARSLWRKCLADCVRPKGYCRGAAWQGFPQAAVPVYFRLDFLTYILIYLVDEFTRKFSCKREQSRTCSGYAECSRKSQRK